MSDCISRAALLAAYDAAHVGPPGGARKLIEEASAVEVAPVVRCKDCDKSERSSLFGRGWRFCENNKQHHRDDHFCSYGARKEADGNG